MTDRGQPAHSRREIDRHAQDPVRGDQRAKQVHGPLFIVGMPRSGTKLLRGLLNQSPGVRVLDIETDFLPFLVRWVRDHGPPRDPAQFDALFAAMRNASYFTHRHAAEAFSPQRWREWCDRYDASGLFEGFVRYETKTPRGHGWLWGDKSPAYVRHIPLLLEQFPECRIVHIVRDVRDYCASMRKAWNKDIHRAAYLWGRDVSRAHQQCAADRQRCLQIRYESLLRSPEGQMRRVCRFLGIDYVDEMVRLQRPVENRGDATGSTEILRDNFAKFLSRLTRREIEGIEALAFDAMLQLGYQPLYAHHQRRMTVAEQKLRRLRDGVRLVARSKGKLGLAGALRFHIAHDRLAN